MLAVFFPALDLLFRFVVAERMGTIILSALVAHTAWHWMTERYGVLSMYSFEWPAIDATFVAGLLRRAMIAVALAAGVWLVGLSAKTSNSVTLTEFLTDPV